MVGKVITGDSFIGAINYLLDKEDALLLGTNINADNAHDFAKQMNETFNAFPSKIEKPVKHFIIGFSKEDELKMNINNCSSVVDDYLKKMGYGNNEYVAVQHNDTDNMHIHIIVNRMDVNGISIKDSNEKLKSREVLQLLEKEFNLTKTADSGRSIHDDFNPQKDKHNARIDSEDENIIHIRESIKKTLKNHPLTFDLFKDKLSTMGVVAIVADNKKGLSYKYGSTIIKSSVLSRQYSLPKLTNRFATNASFQFNRDLKASLKENPISLDDLFRSLIKKGYLPSVNAGKNGWTLKKDGITIKGSDLSRMGLKKINSIINENKNKTVVKEIRNVIYGFLRSGGDSIRDFEKHCLSNNIFLSKESNAFEFAYLGTSIKESELSGSIGVKGLEYHLEKNKVDNLLTNIGNVNNTIELSAQLSRHSIKMNEKDGQFEYQFNQKIFMGNDLNKNKDKVVLDKMNKLIIKSLSYKTMKNCSDMNDFIFTLGKQGINTNIDAINNKIAYSFNGTTLNKGKVCNYLFVNDKLNQNSLVMKPNNQGIKLRDMTTQNREDEDEEVRRQKGNNEHDINY